MKKLNLRRLIVTGVAVGAMTVTLASCSSSSSSSNSGSSGSSGSSSIGSTVTVAEAPQTPPNYIFPFMGLQFFSVSNINQFQFLMYRPLYWFGSGNTPNLNPSLSLASVPVYSNNNTTVTINLKNYKYSNGETVNASSVMFFMNMLHAEKTNWAAYSAGYIPDDIKSITANSDTQITMTLTGSVNPYWFTYNELSQITPFPKAWDVSANGAASGSGGCYSSTYAGNDAGCTAVYNYLSNESGFNPNNPQAANNQLSSYATNPLWQIVDGPFKLSAFDASGNVTFVPNPSYSGPVKPTFKEVKLVPFTTDDSEFNALVSGSVDVGYLPPQDITSNWNGSLTGAVNNSRVSGNYNLAPSFSWAINYFPYNFNSTGDNGNAGKIFSQLYFRQAFQTLVNQPQIITSIDKGYGVPTYGPVPVKPSTFASSGELNNSYPYSVTKATNLLKDHGWTVTPNGTDTCNNPGTGASQCGAGIAKGAQLNFTLEYASGSSSLTSQMNAEKSAWAQAGINVTLTTASFNTVLGHAVACTGGSSCSWELENWGGGWIFAPDYYPTGEEIFQTGAGSNSGSYSSTTNDANIKATNTENISLTTYENYLAQQLPVVNQPNAVGATEIHKGLSGVTPVSVLQQLNPENWRG